MRTFFLILIFCLVASYHFWRDYLQPTEKATRSETAEWQADYIATNLNSTRFDKQGFALASMQSKKMEYFDELGFAYFKESEYWLFQTEQSTNWQLNSKQGTLTDNNLLTLEQGVEVTTNDKNALVYEFLLAKVEVDLTNKTLYSDSEITAKGNNLLVTGNQLSGDFNSLVFELKNDAQTIIKQP